MEARALIRVGLLALLPAVLMAGSGKAADPARARLAGDLAALASWCADQGLKAEGRALLEEAIALDAEAPKVVKAGSALEKAGAPRDGAAARWAKRQREEGVRIAAGYRGLAARKTPAAEPIQRAAWWVRAFAHDPDGSAQALDAAWAEARRAGDLARARLILEGAQAVRPDPARAEALAALALALSTDAPALRVARAHPMRYYVSMPKGWDPSRRWPVLVAVEGAGSAFEGHCREFARQRGDRPFIVVTPLTVSSTNDLMKAHDVYPEPVREEMRREWGGQGQLGPWRKTFDLEGLLAVLDDLRADCGAEDRVWITGFSGGGVLTWMMVMTHPERLAGAAPACANFFGHEGPLSQDPARESLSVKAFQGDQDPYWKDEAHNLERQWEAASGLCREAGYRRVEREILAGAGHVACAAQVWALIDAGRKP